MKKTLFIAVFLSIGILLASCSQRVLDFTVISSKNISIDVKKDAPRVKSKAKGTIKGAIDNAIESAGSGYDALLDGVIYQHSWYCVLFYIYTFTVEGTPIKTSEIKSVHK